MTNTPPSTKPNGLKIFLADRRASIRIGNFMKVKYPALSALIQAKSEDKTRTENTHLFYTSDQFKSLLNNILDISDITGLRIYFANYMRVFDAKNNDLTKDLIAPGKENTLTLIYAPTSGTEIDTGDYFVMKMDHTIANLKDASYTGVAKAWVKSFQTDKWDLLNTILQNMSGQTETKSLLYAIAGIKELRDFLNDSNSDPEDAIAVFFGAYHLQEDPPKKKISYTDKLTLVFAFMDKLTLNAVDYYYYDNEPENDPELSADIVSGGGSGDTGVPCPPPTCSGTSLP